MDILANELHKVAKKKYDVRPVNVLFCDEVWAIDLVDMIEWSKLNKGFKYILTIIDVFSKYAFAVPLHNKTGQTITDVFSTIFEKRTPKKIWSDAGKEFYNKTFESLLKKYNIVLYSTYSNNKSVVVERFNRTLKTSMFKMFTKNNNRIWVDILPQLIDDYNNKIHSTIGMSPTDALKMINYETVLENTLKARPRLIRKKPKFKIGDVVRVSRVKNIFEHGYIANWSQETFDIVKVLNTNPITYKLKDMNGEILEGSFYTEELQKTQLKNTLLIEEIIKERTVKGKKQYYVKYLGMSKKFNKWLDEKDLIDLDQVKAD
jgi:hypothetical protein